MVNVNRKQSARSARPKRAAMFVLAAIVIAGIIPACATAACCLTLPGSASMHADMPCCQEQSSSITANDPGRLQPAPVTGSPTLPLQWGLADLAKPVSNSAALRVFATLAAVRQAHSEPPPHLFLHNAQFLI
jgi:hypothetical protein